MYLFLAENKITDLARKMEKQFAERVAKKPAGGVSVLPQRKDEVQELSVSFWFAPLLMSDAVLYKRTVGC